MHRFFIPGIKTQADGKINLSPVAHQLQRVLRLAPGAQLMVLDGTGLAYTTEIIHLEKSAAWGTVIARHTLPEPVLHLSLYQCALKTDKFEWVLQKGTELGISRFVPVVSARTIVRPVAALEKKRPRWEAILREAAEQCGRGRIPTLAPAQDWQPALTAHTDEHHKLIAWEEADGDTPPLGKTIASVAHTSFATQPPLHIALCIGPEGGLTPEEVALAQTAGWQTVHLGPRILRAETAALAAATIVMQLAGEFDEAR